MNSNTYTLIPNHIIAHVAKEARPSAFVVYTLLRSYRNNGSGKAWPGRARIAEMAGLSVATVSRAIEELASIGAVEIRRRFGTSSEVIFRDDCITDDTNDGCEHLNNDTSNVAPVTPRMSHGCVTTNTNTSTKELDEVSDMTDDEQTRAAALNEARRNAVQRMRTVFARFYEQDTGKKPVFDESTITLAERIIDKMPSESPLYRCEVAPYIVHLAWVGTIWPFTQEKPRFDSILRHADRLLEGYYAERDAHWPALLSEAERRAASAKRLQKMDSEGWE